MEHNLDLFIYPVITYLNKLGRESLSILKKGSASCVGLNKSDIFK